MAYVPTLVGAISGIAATLIVTLSVPKGNERTGAAVGQDRMRTESTNVQAAPMLEGRAPDRAAENKQPIDESIEPGVVPVAHRTWLAAPVRAASIKSHRGFSTDAFRSLSIVAQHRLLEALHRDALARGMHGGIESQEFVSSTESLGILLQQVESGDFFF